VPGSCQSNSVLVLRHVVNEHHRNQTQQRRADRQEVQEGEHCIKTHTQIDLGNLSTTFYDCAIKFELETQHARPPMRERP